MHTVITVLRFPVGLVGIAILSFLALAFFVAWAIVESVLAIPAIVFGSIFATKKLMTESWIGKYPNFLRDFKKADGLWPSLAKTTASIWRWVVNPDEGGEPDIFK